MLKVGDTVEVRYTAIVRTVGFSENSVRVESVENHHYDTFTIGIDDKVLTVTEDSNV